VCQEEKKMRAKTCLLIGATLILLIPAVLTTAQDTPPEPGICGGAICGPSGAFTVHSFPTLTNIDWAAFPANPPRPYTGGRALYVAVDGSDTNPGTADAPFATLTYAVDQAQTGDVIWVQDGEYAVGEEDMYEALSLDRPGITLAAEHPGGVVLRPASAAQAIGIAARADDLIVDGFVITGFRSVGIEFGRGGSPQRNLVLKHLRVEQTEEGIRSTYNGDGSTPLVDGLLIYDVWLRDTSVIGLQCGMGPCNNMRWEALRVEMPTGDTDNSGADALALESGENIVVFNAEITGAPGDGIDLKTNRAAVANVIVHDIGRNGIKIWHGGDIVNALVYNTGADAAIVFEAGTYRILNTLVARHAWGDRAYAMTAAYDEPTLPGRVEIINSVFYQNSGAIWISSAMALDVRNSLFFGSANQQELVWEPVSVGEGDSPISALESAGGGANNLGFLDPGFANPDAGDYAWNTTSPLFDAGTADVPLPDFDLYGNPRVIGLAVDLGPVEVQPAP
jgi:hypothetical protein